jgi:hypothetical protein
VALAAPEATVSYTVLVADPGGAWRELHARRRYTLTAALYAFDAEVIQGERGVRVCCGRVQVAAYWPRRAA